MFSAEVTNSTSQGLQPFFHASVDFELVLEGWNHVSAFHLAQREPHPVFDQRVVDACKFQLGVRSIEDREYDPLESVDYKSLKQDHTRIVKKIQKLEKPLIKEGWYDKIADFALELGIGDDLSNIREVIGEMLKEWQGPMDHLHQFISAMEAVKEKREIERRLAEIRLNDLSIRKIDPSEIKLAYNIAFLRFFF